MDKENRIYAPVTWPYYLIGNSIFLIIISLALIAVITIRNNLVGQHLDSLMDEIYATTATVGWGLDDVTIEGRNKTAKADLMKAVNLHRGDNILEIDLPELRERIKNLPWVKDVSITRRYFPNVISINIREKNVKSIWQYKNEFYQIDEDGKTIDTEYVTAPLNKYLLIVGEDAPNHINELQKILEKNPELYSRVKAANYISKRRWNLIFDDINNGITVKLPETDIEEAWKKLVKLDKTRGILKRKLTFIDLRLKNKVVVKIRNGNVN